MLAQSGQEDELPHYSALRLRPSRGLPKELQAMEASAQFKERSEAMFEQLRTGVRPPTDIPIFTTLIGQNGPLTLQLGEHLCLLLFSHPYKAADYARTQLTGHPPPRYMTLTLAQAAELVRDVRRFNITRLTLDRCPRCDTLTVVESKPDQSDADMFGVWATFKSAELTRISLYTEFAAETARAGMPDIARDILLETVGHVDITSADAHIGLALMARLLGDQVLRKEAETFLEFLKVPGWRETLAGSR